MGSNSDEEESKGGLEKGHGKGGLKKGHGKDSLKKGKGKGGLKKGHGKGGLKKGHGKGGLKKGHGKGGLKKGHGKGSLKKGKGKGGLKKGHGKGGLDQGKDLDPQQEAKYTRIQDEMASGFKLGWQESRGRSSRWSRQDWRRSDPTIHAKRQAWLQGKRPETRPEAEKMKVGSQRWRHVNALAAENAQAKGSLYRDKKDFLSKKYVQKRQLEEQGKQLEAWKKAPASFTSSSSMRPATRPCSNSERLGKKPDSEEESEMEEVEVDLEDL